MTLVHGYAKTTMLFLLYWSELNMSWFAAIVKAFQSLRNTRSQAVARIADRTATQQTHVRSYAKNCRGHVT